MPNDFISREALDELMSTIELPEERYRGDESNRDMFFMGINDAWEAIDRLPAADVVPVVRCGECIHRVNMEHSMDNKEICCGRMAMRVMALDDYCSHGVRIDGGERHA